jgi:hypothetical protein
MAGRDSNVSNFGSFVPTTNVWDVSSLYEIDVTSDEFKELLVRLYQNLNLISLNLNIKDTGYYDLQQFVNGQLYFQNPSLSSLTPQSPTYRQVYRLVVNFGALPNAGSKSVAHNISVTSGFSFTRIYATATKNDQTSFIPIPFASPILNENIKLEVTNTNVTITTAIDYSAYTITYVVLEYLKQ